MVKRIRNNLGLQLFLIALFLATFTLSLSLSAFLAAETDSIDALIHMQYGTDFGVTISAPNYKEDSIIVPGGDVLFDPVLTNMGDYDTYVFIRMQLPEESFTLANMDDGWKRLSGDDEDIYYYGSREQLTALGRRAKNADGSLAEGETTAPLCTAIRLDSKTDLLDEDYLISATGYAIQTRGLGTTDPASVWSILQDAMAEGSGE